MSETTTVQNELRFPPVKQVLQSIYTENIIHRPRAQMKSERERELKAILPLEKLGTFRVTIRRLPDSKYHNVNQLPGNSMGNCIVYDCQIHWRQADEKRG